METMKECNLLTIQKNVRQFWSEQNIYQKAKQRLAGKEKYYFIDGPPYTSGQVHLGTAWNKSLKDMLLRIKRMQGFDVWDRAGYDMHGLPIEHATEKELGIQGAKEIREFGVDAFIDACKDYATKNMLKMNDVFRDLGLWLDFENAYQTLSKTYMDGEWWFIKTAFEKGRLYEGLRTTMWDPKDATAVAKHESEYKSVEDTAIFVKFPVKDNEFLLVWTTTPWTIPFNLAVMVNPDLDYHRVQVDEEQWWIAADLYESVLQRLVRSGKILETVKGTELEGLSYTHPFAKDMGFDALAQDHKALHTVLLSKEYVDTSAGSGLVHCAPGCGPEDFEVGYRNGLPAFNTVDVHGVFQESGQFSGLRAKKDDALFIQKIEDAGCLVHQHAYVHDYPHAERSKEAVIFRTTKQWFIKVDDSKDQLIRENNKIKWLPQAGYNAFNSWLENLRDNSISKQRFWGTPLPIWRNVDDPEDILVIGSAKELESLVGKTLDDLHISTVDALEISQDGKTYKRVPDVLDVWVDAGTALWNALRLSVDDPIQYVPVEFIVEGKDQIRGWFNLLHICGNVAFGEKAFKRCYMHGYINDSSGRKMSKSLQNYITPAEVTEQYGVDTFRMYVIGGTNPGLDLNYNFDDVSLRQRNLLVLWNIHKFVLDMEGEFSVDLSRLDVEEEYVFSKLHSLIDAVNQKVEEYKLDDIPRLIETFFLDVSRTYIQLIREKAASGSFEQKQTVFSTLVTVLDTVLRLLAPITPFVTEQMYANLKTLDCSFFQEESVHFESWPSVDASRLNLDLERSFAVSQEVITAGLSARDKAKRGVRWPCQAVILDVESKDDILVSLVSQQLNVKEVRFESIPVSYEVKPNYRALGKAFGKETADVLTSLQDDSFKGCVVDALNAGEESFSVDSFEFSKEMFDLEVLPKEGSTVVLFDQGKIELDTSSTPALEAEGFARELTRRIQQLRKDEGLEKSDSIVVEIVLGDLPEAVLDHKEPLMRTCGVREFLVVEEISFPSVISETVKGKSFSLGMKKEE